MFDLGGTRQGLCIERPWFDEIAEYEGRNRDFFEIAYFFYCFLVIYFY